MNRALARESNQPIKRQKYSKAGHTLFKCRPNDIQAVYGQYGQKICNWSLLEISVDDLPGNRMLWLITGRANANPPLTATHNVAAGEILSLSLPSVKALVGESDFLPASSRLQRANLNIYGRLEDKFLNAA